MQEEKIIDLMRQRDEHGITELLKHSEPLIRYIIRPILPSEQEQDECLSDVTLKIWNAIDGFDPQRGTWNAWITAIARNTALNRARANRRFPPSETVSDTLPSPTPSPEEAALQAERRAALSRALKDLPVRDRALFYRKYYYMQSTAQISSELGMTERAVEGRLYRLKKQLRTILGGE